MRDDRNEELQRLEEALLAEEQPSEDMDSTMVFSPAEVASKACTVRNTDRVDVEMDAFAAQVQQPDTRRVNPSAVFLLVLLTVAFLGVIAWWLLRMRGLL